MARLMEQNIQNLYEDFAGLAPFRFATTRVTVTVLVFQVCA